MNARSGTAAVKRGGIRWAPVLMRALVAIAASATPALAQEDIEGLAVGETLYEIRLTDGSVLFARVIEVAGEMIVLVTSGGARLELERSQIREARVAQGRVVEGEFWRKDSNTSRLFFTATGRTLDKGNWYAGTTLIFLPWVAELPNRRRRSWADHLAVAYPGRRRATNRPGRPTCTTTCC